MEGVTMSKNPAEQYLALKAIQSGLAAALKVVERQVDEVRQVFGSKSFDSQLGTLGLTITKPKVGKFDRAALLSIAREQYPHEVTEAWIEHVPAVPAHDIEHPPAVSATLESTLRKRFKVKKVAGVLAVVDEVENPESGEVTDVVVPWAEVDPGGEHWTARLTDDAKSDAARAIVSKLDVISGILEEPSRPSVDA
jgi:hypothetical protein